MGSSFINLIGTVISDKKRIHSSSSKVKTLRNALKKSIKQVDFVDTIVHRFLKLIIGFMLIVQKQLAIHPIKPVEELPG